jgi:hypothetical protein
VNPYAVDIALDALRATGHVGDDRPVVVARPVAPVDVSVESVSPAMAPRPDGMSRQVQRALYRKLCKRAGLDWRRKRT